MVIAVGDRFVRRHNAARGSTSNGAAADISYDTAELEDGTGYGTWGADETDAIRVDTAGKYLWIGDLGQCDIASTRACGTIVPVVDGVTQQPVGIGSHRYLRNSGGAQEGASLGMGILDVAANVDIGVRNPGTLSPTDTTGNYATNVNQGGALQLVYLGDGSLTHLERTSDAAEVGISNINATRPWLNTSGTWTKMTWPTEVSDDDSLHAAASGDVILAANTKYMIVWTTVCFSTDASRHTYVTRLSVNGTIVQTSSGYQRNTASQGPPMQGMYLVETGGSAETIFLEATQESEGADAGTPQFAEGAFQIYTLDSAAEWIHVDNGATDSMTTALAVLTTWYDMPLSSTFRAFTGGDLSLDSGNDAVQNDSGATMSVLAVGWGRWDRDVGNTARKNPWTAWDNGGTRLGYGINSAFNRGNQSTDDTFQSHCVSAALMDLASAADLTLQWQDEATANNSDMGIYASTSRHFLGVQVLDVSTLAGGGAGTTVTPAVIPTTSTVPASTPQGQALTTPAVVSTPYALAAATPQGQALASPTAVVADYLVGGATPTGAAVVSPSLIAAPYAIGAAQALAASLVTPSVTAAAYTLAAATPQGQGAATPAVVLAPYSLDAAAALAAALVAPSVIAADYALPAAAALAAALVAPAVILAPYASDTPTISIGKTVTPAVILADYALPAPTVQAGALVTVAVLTVDYAIPAATALGQSLVSPGVIPAAYSLGAATAGGQALALPAVILADYAVPLATPLAASLVAPAVVPAPYSIDQATPVIGGGNVTVTPAVLIADYALDQAIVLVAATVTPSSIVADYALPAPTRSGAALTTPSVLTADYTLAVPTTLAASLVIPSTITAPYALPTVISAGILILVVVAPDVAVVVRFSQAQPRLVVAIGGERTTPGGYREWERISSQFRMDGTVEGIEAVNTALTAAWATNSGASQPVLTTAINEALQTAGYRRSDGEDLA